MKFPPRFSLRTLFVLIALLSIPLGWATYQLNWIRQRHEVLASRTIDGVKERIILGFNSPPRTAPWSLRAFGEEGYEDFMLDLREADPELARIRRLFPEARVLSMNARK